MTHAVLLHGNPETAAIWGPMLEVMQIGEVDTLSPPGFGAPAGDDFGATADDYAAWLISVLEKREAPVDLVGHDWGGGHVVRVAVDRPDLIRSWAIDVGGCLAPDYVWHDMARVWQTPGAGEDALAGMVSLPCEERVAMFESIGMVHGVAARVAPAVDRTMARCILALYRSAAQPVMAELGKRLHAAAARPGLVIVPTEDPYTGGEERARWAACEAGAELALLPGLGHWWMLQDPAGAAAVLRSFWQRL